MKRSFGYRNALPASLIWAFCLLLLSVGAVYSAAARNRGYWTELTLSAYHPFQEEFLERYAEGKTRYGSDVYREGAAADRRIYPEGTRLYVVTGEEGRRKGKWFTVDDILPQTTGKRDVVYLRFLTAESCGKWESGSYRVFVVISKKGGK